MSTRHIIICGSTQGVYGGIEVFMAALAEYLHAQPGYRVSLLFKLVRGYTWQDSLHRLVDQLPFPVIFAERGPRALLQHFRTADLIHTQNVPPDVIAAARLLRKPIVATIHNWRRDGLDAHALLWRIGHTLVQARTYNSQFVRRTWSSQPESWRSQVIPTVSRLPTKPAPWENRHGFCFVGRWIPNKGLDDLVKAYALAKLDSPEHPLTLLGDGPLRPQIEQSIQKHALQHVHLPGLVSDEDKYRLIGSSRWLVAPPRTREDLGLTPIEARSLRIPVIASRDGGIPEAAGESALYFDPGDIEALATRLREAANMPDPEYRQRANQGHDSLQTFLKPLSDYTSIYDKLLKH